MRRYKEIAEMVTMCLGPDLDILTHSHITSQSYTITIVPYDFPLKFLMRFQVKAKKAAMAAAAKK